MTDTTSLSSGGSNSKGRVKTNTPTLLIERFLEGLEGPYGERIRRDLSGTNLQQSGTLLLQGSQVKDD
jgi:hypothetical protein